MRRFGQTPGAIVGAFHALIFGVTVALAEDTADLDAIAAQLLPEQVASAVAAIPEEPRKLLAMRSYLRFSGKLEERWSWSEEEIAAFQGSEAQLALQSEIDAISADFAERNPGHAIYVHSRVRSLDTQIDHWNENNSVGVSGAEIHEAWLNSKAATPSPTDPKALARFEKWLKRYTPETRAHIAAPGLSRHGRAQAIDFQITKDGKIIASTDYDAIETEWRQGGWEDKLKASVTAAGPCFSGPLSSLHEPWHYDYTPQPTAADTSGSQ
ncbi:MULTISPECIES: hypothetical protein [unclassified Meridianimarinicoccus]|uniref:hypothetical protein n=1 Tax=unclassified Meridianimarinicoccus TaxID=2923344 RepID=UPI001866A65F|nr:hypothetical protein [Fluviibacterium sp. MJW13]